MGFYSRENQNRIEQRYSPLEGDIDAARKGLSSKIDRFSNRQQGLRRSFYDRLDKWQQGFVDVGTGVVEAKTAKDILSPGFRLMIHGGRYSRPVGALLFGGGLLMGGDGIKRIARGTSKLKEEFIDPLLYK